MINNTTNTPNTTNWEETPKAANSDEDTDDDHIEMVAKFDDMGLKDNLLRGIYAHGFDDPSPIQKQAIVPFLKGKEVIAQAQSGTGKTGAFSISILQQIDTDVPECQAIVMAPTKELVKQIARVIQNIGIHLNVGVRVCIGGIPVREDIQALNNKSSPIHIVVGTPGRIYDLLLRYVKEGKGIDGSKIRYLILDEADEMLGEEGFQDITYDIFQEISSNIQVGLYSATLPPEVLRLSQQFMKNSIKIVVKKELLTLEGIRQYFIGLENDHQKYDTLCDLYKDICVGSSVIFCNSRNRVQRLAEGMSRDDFAVSPIYGTMTMPERNEVMRKFRAGETRVLITTDLLARGIDVQGVSIVINYDLPNNVENYIHRIGRSGRYGRKGLAINLVTQESTRQLRHLEQFYDTIIEELPMNFTECLK